MTRLKAQGLRLVRWVEASWWPKEVSRMLHRRRDRQLQVVLMAMMPLLLIWAALAPVDQIVRAQGRFIASGRSQTVQHLEGGIVTEILVREGQQVVADQPLLRLSPVRANSNLQQGQSKLQALKAAAARLQAEANGDVKVEFPADVDPEFQRLETQAFVERATRFAAEQQALKQQAAQRQAELAEAQGRAKSFALELDISRKQAALLESLWRKGAASELEQLDAQGRVERLNTQLRDVTNAIPRLQSAISEVQARIQETAARTRADARSELNQTTAEIARFEAAVSEDSDRLDRTEVRSPVAGYINRLLVNTIGGVIRTGDPVVEITPKDEVLTVEARVRPDDRATLRPGLSARVKIGAYDFATYGALSAQVLEVSADTLPDENNQRYYRILVQAERAQGALAQQIILPGMTTQVDVVVGQRSVLSYLLSPLMRFSGEAFREPR